MCKTDYGLVETNEKGEVLPLGLAFTYKTEKETRDKIRELEESGYVFDLAGSMLHSHTYYFHKKN